MSADQIIADLAHLSTSAMTLGLRSDDLLEPPHIIATLTFEPHRNNSTDQLRLRKEVDEHKDGLRGCVSH